MRTQTRIATATLADRLAATRAAELAAGVSHECGQVGCHGHASSQVAGVWLCPGHAGFAAVRAVAA